MAAIRIGNNLDVLRGMDRGTVDLIYLDPPFNSGQEYNITVEDSLAQELAYQDVWTWTQKTQEDFDDFCRNPPNHLAQTKIVPLLRTFHGLALFNGNLGTVAYLTMMAPRLVAMYEVLKNTGSFWLHCDETASHYLKIMLDAIFGERFFRAEVIWQRTSSHNNARKPAPIHDTILFYTKSDNYTWNYVYTPYPEGRDEKYDGMDEDGRKWKNSDPTASGVRNGDSGKPWRGVNPTDKGRHWAIQGSSVLEYELRTNKTLEGTVQEKLDALDAAGLVSWSKTTNQPYLKKYLQHGKGLPFRNIITDILPVASNSEEWMEFDGQKPIALLEHIIKASSNEGDLVLDPFLGSGTTLMAAFRLHRRCIGIEMTEKTAFFAKNRFIKEYGEEAFNKLTEEDCLFLPKESPMDLGQARILAKTDPKKLERWVNERIGAEWSWKNSADGGIDGHLLLKGFPDNTTRRVTVQVTAGKNLNHCQAFCWKVTSSIKNKSEGLIAGLYITFADNITPGMRADASAAGKFKPGFDEDDPEFPVIQFITIEELFNPKFTLGGRLPGLVKRPDYSETKESLARRGKEALRHLENLPSLDDDE